MGGKQIGRKLTAMIVLVVVGGAVLVLSPPEIRFIIAPVTIPIEAMALSVVLADSERRIPQP